LFQRRLAAAWHGGRVDHSAANTAATAAAVNVYVDWIDRRVHDTESVPRDGRRYLLQRRLVAAWYVAAIRRIDAATFTAATGDDDYEYDVERRVHDAEPLHGDGRRHLLQRWLVAARYVAAIRRIDATTGTGGTGDDNHNDRADRINDFERWVHDTESVHGDGRRHLLQRRLAAARYLAAVRRIDAATSTATAGYDD